MKHKLIYKINKVIRVILYISLTIFSTIMLTFIIISSSLDYKIPEIETIELYDNEGKKYLSYSNGMKKSYVKLENISDYVIDAFISVEDKRFFDHQGLDFIRICKAAIKDIIKGRAAEGASTITQQYAKNLFLTQDKTWKRKLTEAFIALNLESKYSKEEILEGYLNSIYFDNGIYGIEDAAIYYFNKNSKDLNLIEAVSLAAIPKGPSIYSPIKNPENNASRRNLILKEMLEDELITNEEYEETINASIEYTGYSPFKQDDAAPYFQDYVLKELKNIKGISNISYKGLKVYTTLDLSLNNIILDSINKRIESEDLQTSIVVLDPKTGEIKSLVGGTNYQKSTFNRAINASRQPGSTVKPFLYLTALENGFNVSTTFLSEESTFYINKEKYSPKNYANIYPNQEISMVYALAVSDNIYAVKTHLFLGTDKLKNKLQSLGISGNIPNIPSLSLGTYEINNLEWAGAYQVLANEGRQITPYGITKITTFDDEIVYLANNSGVQKADISDVYILNESMTNIFDDNLTFNIRPTGVSIANRLTKTYAAKSGSTDTDNWMVGYNQDILACVWTGYDDSRPITKKADLMSAKYIWADIVEGATKDLDDNWYDKPENVIGIKLNPITGFYSSFSEYAKILYFKKENVPWYIKLLL